MSELLKAIAIFLGLMIATSMQAQTILRPTDQAPIEDTCSNTKENDNCVRFAGCFGRDGTFFHGRALGWNAGTLEAEVSNGATCKGQWTIRNSLGVGQALFNCSDGVTGSVYYHYQDPETGTAEGTGFSNDFRYLKMWAGENLDMYFRKSKKTGLAIMECGGEDIPIS